MTEYLKIMGTYFDLLTKYKLAVTAGEKTWKGLRNDPMFPLLSSPPCVTPCSEHSRHWFFKGQLYLDGKKVAQSLFESIMRTQESSNPNNVLKFCDNSR